MFINAIHAGIESGSVVGSAKKSRASKPAFKGAPMVGVGGKAVASTAAAGTSAGMGFFMSLAALAAALFVIQKDHNDKVNEIMTDKEAEDYIDMRIKMDNTLG